LIDKPQAVLTSDWLAIESADVLIAPDLATLLGRPDLAGNYIGVFDAQISFASASSTSAMGAAVAGGAACVGDFSLPADLEMTILTGLSQAVREPGGRIAMAPSATLVNNGPGDVQWYRAIAPSSPVGPHPFLVLNFYRLSGGVLEQIGRADVKHAYFAVNDVCGCTPGHIFYAGCEDVYGINTNLDRFNLAPRGEVNALAASWASLGSHFDGTPVDNTRNHGGTDHDDFEHRLVVREPDLQTAGARYFYEGWYLGPNDPDLENSMGRREVDPTFGGSTWTFPPIGSTTVTGSILDVWVDPQNVQPGQSTELLDTGEGRVQLAAVTSSQGGGNHHYEYALMNFDFERRVQSFSLPIGPGQSVSNTGFDDGDTNAANDWTASIAGGSVTWTAPAGNALDFGMLFNFRLDANAAPVQGTARITPFEAGNPTMIPVQTLPESGRGRSIAACLILLAILARQRR
jgi:hypothetical protein